MKLPIKSILNLVYPDKSDLKYEISRFPDGQQSITIKEECDEMDNMRELTIKTRLNNFMDLEILICAVKALRTWGFFLPIHLYVPYFLGSRSDRCFEQYAPNYLRDIICPIINGLKFKTVTVTDPHSHVLEGCLQNFRKIPFEKLMDGFFRQGAWLNKGLKDVVYIAPDKGAEPRVEFLAKLGCDIVYCIKHRKPNGDIDKLEVPLQHKHLRRDYYVIDDICDGGATFIRIGKELRKVQANDPHAGKNTLIVTHGLFTKGFEELNLYYDSIYCTNSYKDIYQLTGEDYSTDNLKIGQKDFTKLVKQLNVF